MRTFIDSTDGRKTTFFDKLKPHMSKPVDIDGLIGIYKFSLTKLISPTMEFLDTLGNIGRGHFETMYDIYQIQELQFTPDFGKYQIFFKVFNQLLDYKTYLNSKNARWYFVDESFFIVVPKEETIATVGTILISTGNDVVKFLDAPKTGAIHLYENLYMEMSLNHIEIFSSRKPLNAYELCLADLEIGTGVKLGNTVSNKTALIEMRDTKDVLSSIGVIVYEKAGEKGFEFRDINYASWNQSSAVLDIKALEDEIGTGTTITKLLILYSKGKEDKGDVGDLYSEFIDACNSKEELRSFVKGLRANLQTMSNDDPRLIMDFGKDDIYFSNIKSISKQFALDMLGEEYSKIRNEVKITEEGTNYVFFVPNRFSQVISIYINGRYFQEGFIRDD